MSRINFTKKLLEGLPAPGGDHYVIFRDSGARGLGLKVEVSGHKVFFWSRRARGKLEWKTIGEFESVTVDDARAKASEFNKALNQWKSDGALGGSPFARPAAALTLDGLVNEYVQRHLKHHAKNPAQAEAALRWAVGKYIPAWRTRRLGEIRNEDVRALHRKIGAAHQRTANGVVKMLRTLYNFAAKENLWSGANPAKGISFYFEPSRERFLQPEELPPFFAALRRAPSQDLKDFVALALWTAARKADILGMRWQDVSLADNKWVVPNPKSRHAYTIPLVPEAIEILRERLARRRDVDNGWVFPSHGESGHLADLKKAWRALLQDAGLYSEDRAVRLRVHDLRRTAGSWLAGQGASLPLIGRVLGHQPGSGATSVYSRLNLDSVRTAMQQASTAIRLAASKKPKLLKAARRA